MVGYAFLICHWEEVVTRLRCSCGYPIYTKAYPTSLVFKYHVANIVEFHRFISLDDYFEPVKKPKATQPSPEPAAPKPKVAPPPVSVPAPKPKRRLGIFNKSKDARETDINALLAPGAQAPEFAALLAKVLTFGAPGRFPVISSMSNMPFKEFDLDTAKELLTQARSDADLTDEQSAETFASVVNCMIIDIIDLASATVKGKDSDDKLTTDAISVVMDFMDHAASLFDAVASDVTIKPVTYGGSLKKKDL